MSSQVWSLEFQVVVSRFCDNNSFVLELESKLKFCREISVVWVQLLVNFEIQRS